MVLPKWLAEEMCDAFTARTGIETICLRAVAVFDKAGYARMIATRARPSAARRRLAREHTGRARDLADATAAAIACPPFGHNTRADRCGRRRRRRPTRELLDLYAHQVPWRGGAKALDNDPYMGLVSLKRAKKVLNWKPRYRWPGRV